MTLYNGGVPTCISIHALREEGDQGRADRARPEGSISIHALREEGDPALLLVSSLMIYFYPRPPRGGRRFASFGGNLVDQFLSTPSARRATMWPRRRPRSCRYFYPRPPRGGRRYKLILSGTPVQFLSTPSARRATGFA